MSDLVAEFCSITGAPPSVASSLLTVCNNSLEMAINMHMENGGTEVNGNGEGGTSSGSLDQPGPSEEVVRAPIPQKVDTLIEPGYEGYPLAKGNPHKARIRSVFDGFRNFSNETQDDARLPVSRKKKRTLEELFKPPLDLTFKGSFTSARDSATNSKKWLLINIQDAGEFQCQLLNRDVWSNEAVRSILEEHFVFWQQYVESEDAQRYMTFYPVDNYPYVSVIDPRTGEKLVEWNKLDSTIFCDLVTEFLSSRSTLDAQKNSEQPPNKKRKSDDSEDFSVIDATEEDQIAMAIKASLEASKEKVRNMDSDSETDLPFDEEDSNSSIISTNIESSTKSGKSSNSAASNPSMKDEPSRKWEDYVGKDDDPISSIMIRFPDGEKESKKFPSTSKLLAVILYIISKGFPSESHEIVTNFPRRIITDLDDQKTLEEHGLFPQETLFVQKR